MKKTLFLALLVASLSCLAQTSSFTYQGRLNDGGAAGTGSYDFQFSLRDAASAGNQIAGTVTNAAVVVSNGLFTVTLDFGATVFEGSARYLEIGVRTNGNTGAFSMLAPRQQVTSAPYAIQSANAAVATTAANVTGAISDSQLSSNIPRLNGSATFGGGVTATSFNGNGVGLTNLPAANLIGTLPDARLSINVPLLNGSPTFSGTVTATTFSGSGVSLTSLNAGNLSSGTLPDTRLSANVALLSSSPIFTGTVSGFGFSGSGAGLTSLSASQLSSGSVPDARLSANVALLSGSPTFSGTVAATSFSGSGSGLNNLNAGNISTGTIPGAQIGGTYGNAVTFNNAGNSFTGNGTGLTNVNAATLNGMGSTAFWYRAGNGGTSAGTDFIGTTDNQPLEFKVNGQRALRLEPNASGAPNVIGGARFNQVDVGIVGATISGGGATNYVGNGITNRVSADFGVIGGGAQNAIQASASYSTIGGGQFNTIQSNAQDATIPGGLFNEAGGNYSFAAGYRAKATHRGAFVWGDSTDADFTSTGANQFLIRASGGVGVNKTNPATALDVAGTVTATAFIGDGSGLTGVVPVTSNQTFTGTVNFNPSSGAPFTVNGTTKVANLNADLLDGFDASAFWQSAGNAGTRAATDFIGTTDNQPLEFKVNGQRALRLEPNASGAPNVVGGAPFNQVDAGIVGATISGGGATNYVGNGFTNRVSADFGVIGGGAQNAIQASAPYSTIGGGGSNLIQTNASGSTIGGGYANAILTTASYSTIAGGVFNTVQPGAFDSIISGGIQNTIQTNAFASAIGGGQGNTIRTNSYDSTIGGGQGNTIQANASSSTIGGGYVNAIQTGGYYSTIGGGYVNTILTNAFYSTIGGGFYNTNGGQYAVIPGGSQNFAGGNRSFAAGTRAKANHDGALVWADFNNFDFPSLVTNSFSVRSIGGARFVSGIDASGNPTAGVMLAADGMAWTTLSDRNAKKNFQPLDKKEVLEKLAAIPVQHWNYKWEENSAVPHIGPVAQDFKSAFYPGRDDKSITTLEFDGIELAAIQGLHQIMKEKDAKISELELRLSALEHLVSSLSERK